MWQQGRIALAALVLAAGPAMADETLLRALRESDTGAMTRFVETRYREAGASTYPTLVWNSQPFDALVNWYSEHSEHITLADMPRPEEVARYWDNWSTALTGGGWNWQGFFADDEEALLLANFNQFVLAAHEYGHALTYRYDPDHNRRGDYEINCREYPADRLAAALVEEVAEADPRLAALRGRYGELIAAINAAVSKKSRYHVDSLEALEADCRILHVEQPTAATMAPYASAFFARWRVLLEADLPPLAAIYEAHLFPHLAARLAPLAAGAGPVETVAVLEGVSFAPVETATGEMEFVPGLDAAGGLHLLGVETGGGAGRVDIAFAYGPAGAKLKPLVSAGLDLEGVDGRFLTISSFVPLGPDRLLAGSGDLLALSGDVVLFDLRRGAAGWTLAAMRPLPGVEAYGARLVADETGGLWLYHLDAGSDAWRETALDPETLAARSSALRPGPSEREPLARASDGRLFQFDTGTPSLIVDEPGGAAQRFAGTGLTGYRDHADAAEAELYFVSLAVPLPDRLRLLDFDPVREAYVLRDVALPP